MIELLNGRLLEKNPANAVIECGGVGYYVHISLYTYEKLSSNEACRIYIHQVIREDEHLLFGFAEKEERQLFRHLISVNGVGPNTARLILSSYKPRDIQSAIVNENADLLKTIKGIGLKTAQRIVIDLRDKVAKDEPQLQISSLPNNTTHNEALSALIALGFDKGIAFRSLQKVAAAKGGDLPVEVLIKEALKQL
jgi:Holliday junction DNA helicase RuvA